MGGISPDILEFLQNVLIMHELKTGLNADKFATFWMLPESFYRLFAGLPHLRACQALHFFANTSRNKKFALRAASSLESTTRD